MGGCALSVIPTQLRGAALLLVMRTVNLGDVVAARIRYVDPVGEQRGLMT
jgi:hypothetical protein